jgi:alpha-ketoglutarate-dependent taurine dioxygenase
MARKEHTVKFTDNELSRLNEKEGTLSDWGKAASMTAAEIEAHVASDADEDEMVMNWDNATIDLPQHSQKG